VGSFPIKLVIFSVNVRNPFRSGAMGKKRGSLWGQEFEMSNKINKINILIGGKSLATYTGCSARVRWGLAKRGISGWKFALPE
jgi:hypothetical protein